MTWQILTGDCIESMRTLDDESVDAVVCDPPYSLGFMGRAWDSHGAPADATFGYWLAGFVDGEGCFRVQRHGRGTHSCTFSIKVRRDERGTLERIARFLGTGSISNAPGEGNARPTSRLAVQDREGCQRVVETFARYPLRAKKARDFWGWAEAVAEWSTMERGNRWHGPADQSRMAALKARIEAGREFEEPIWTGHPFQDWCREWATEALRVLKPGGHLLAFGGTRTYHRLACAIEDGGFEIRDSIMWLYGSGFPKSLDVSKAIDKAAGVEFSASPASGVGFMGPEGPGGYNVTKNQLTRQGEQTDEAREWDGWGTALKPAHEPIVIARKPFRRTVATNVLEHGTGALNIDGCRLGTDDQHKAKCESAAGNPSNTTGDAYGEYSSPRGNSWTPLGRWPANVILDEEAAAELDAQTGELHSQDPATRKSGSKVAGVTEMGTGRSVEYGDSGGASRFFYCAKTSRGERNAGLDDFASKGLNWSSGEESSGTFQSDGTNREARNHHPTVKPINLIRWLVRLVTPPGGTVLDPFTGSGSTGCAAVLEGFNFIGCEREPEYVEIAEARIAFWAQHVGREIEEMLGIVATSNRERDRHEDMGQGRLELDVA